MRVPSLTGQPMGPLVPQTIITSVQKMGTTAQVSIVTPAQSTRHPVTENMGTRGTALRDREIKNITPRLVTRNIVRPHQNTVHPLQGTKNTALQMTKNLSLPLERKSIVHPQALVKRSITHLLTRSTAPVQGRRSTTRHQSQRNIPARVKKGQRNTVIAQVGLTISMGLRDL